MLARLSIIRDKITVELIWLVLLSFYTATLIHDDVADESDLRRVLDLLTKLD